MSEALVPQVMKNLAFDKRPILTEIRRQLTENPQLLSNAIAKLLALASEGHLGALQIVMERCEGKAVQMMVVDHETPYAFDVQVAFGPEACPHCGGKL